MAFKYQDDNGNEIEAYTKEEYEQIQAEAKRVKELEEELERQKKVSAEKSESFKKLNERTEAEKAAMDINTLEALKRVEMLEHELAEERRIKQEQDNLSKTTVKETIVKIFAGESDDIKTKVLDNYQALAGMPENTPEEIKARMEKAAVLSNIQIPHNTPNPLYASMFGSSAPQHDDNKEYIDTPEGKSAYESYQNYKKNQGVNHF